MSTLSAKEFLRRLISDNTFRKSLYLIESHDERTAHLAREGFAFNEDEFEEAVSLLLAEGQPEADAATLADLSLWWKMLAGSMAEESCGSGCAPSACASCSSDCNK